MKELKGYFVPILTPFNQDGSVDEPAMRENIAYLIQEGIHGITMTGSFGEFPLLSSAERIRLYQVGVEAAAGRCAIVAGTAHASTAEVLHLNRAAAEAGVDGLMITPPYYLVPSPHDMKEHFRRIDGETDLPITIYNNPTRTGVNMSPALLDELSRWEHIVTVKQSSKDFFELLELIRRSQDVPGFHVTNGLELRAFPALIMGAEATYGVSPLLLGRECIDLYRCAQEEDLERGRKIQFKVNFIRAAFARCQATPAAALRYLANRRGLAGGHPRAPITDLSAEDRRILDGMSREVAIRPVE